MVLEYRHRREWSLGSMKVAKTLESLHHKVSDAKVPLHSLEGPKHVNRRGGYRQDAQRERHWTSIIGKSFIKTGLTKMMDESKYVSTTKYIMLWLAQMLTWPLGWKSALTHLMELDYSECLMQIRDAESPNRTNRNIKSPHGKHITDYTDLFKKPFLLIA